MRTALYVHFLPLLWWVYKFIAYVINIIVMIICFTWMWWYVLNYWSIHDLLGFTMKDNAQIMSFLRAVRSGPHALFSPVNRYSSAGHVGTWTSIAGACQQTCQSLDHHKSLKNGCIKPRAKQHCLSHSSS